jgi:acyl-CoA synthetase (AMP-forming)/AMP-acid ligase II
MRMPDRTTSTAAAAFAESAARTPQAPVLLVLEETAAAYAIASGEITYAQAAAEIGRPRAAYAAAGYGFVHRVGLMLENRPAFFFHWLALNDLGAGVVPLSPDQRPPELEYLARHSEIVLGVAADRWRMSAICAWLWSISTNVVNRQSAARAAKSRPGAENAAFNVTGQGCCNGLGLPETPCKS